MVLLEICQFVFEKSEMPAGLVVINFTMSLTSSHMLFVKPSDPQKPHNILHLSHRIMHMSYMEEVVSQI